jgi:hypothetical protein
VHGSERVRSGEWRRTGAQEVDAARPRSRRRLVSGAADSAGARSGGAQASGRWSRSRAVQERT